MGRGKRRTRFPSEAGASHIFEDDDLVNFFAEGVEISHHFRTGRNQDCSLLFLNRYGKETASALERLSRLRLQTVLLVCFFLF